MTPAATWRLLPPSYPQPVVQPPVGARPLNSNSSVFRRAHCSQDARAQLLRQSEAGSQPVVPPPLSAGPLSSTKSRIVQRAHGFPDAQPFRKSGAGAGRRIDSRQFRVFSAAEEAGSHSDGELDRSRGAGLGRSSDTASAAGDRSSSSDSASSDRISNGATAATDRTAGHSDSDSASQESFLREEGSEEGSVREDGGSAPAVGFYSLSESEAQLPVLQGSQFVKPLATLYPKQPKPPCKACQDTGMVACAVCDGRGWLPKGGFQKRNPVNISRIIGSKWTAMERTFGWRHFRVKSKRRTANKEWFVEMVATCDENSQFWVNAQNLKDRARWGMGWLQKSELLVLSPASFQQPTAGQVPTNLWESAPAPPPGVPDSGVPPPSGVPDSGVPPTPPAAAASAARLECKACRGSCLVSCKPCEERKKREEREEVLRNAQAGKSPAGSKPDTTIVVI